MSGLTEMGWIIDGATKGELAAYDAGCAEGTAAVIRILDGKDTGAGVSHEPWESLRRRLIALVVSKAKVDKAYRELVTAVHMKFSGESLHQTALRYLQRAELNTGVGQGVCHNSKDST